MSTVSFSVQDRVEIFIDLMNIETAVGRGKVDYMMLCRCLAKGRPISSVKVYDAKKNDIGQEILHRELREKKFRLVITDIKCVNQNKQSGVDVILARDITRCALQSHNDVVIVVSGDGDFVPIIDVVKESGKKIEFASFKESINNDLRNATDRYIALDDLPIILPEVNE